MLLSTNSTPEQSLDPLSLMLASSGVVLVVLLLLIVAATLVWVIWIAKWLQLKRLTQTNRQFEAEASRVTHAHELFALAEERPQAPGAQVIQALRQRLNDPALSPDLLGALSRRAIATEEQKASTLMPTLSSIAAASPFIGLFGTVWGIMDAFLRIGLEKSASLPVVAPAIGEALIATAFGLVAAIPAVIAYNYVDKRIGDLVEELTSSAEVWVAQVYGAQNQARAATQYAGSFQGR